MPTRSGRWALVRSDRRLPGNPAGAVYGTIVTSGQLAVESAAGHGIATMAASLAGTLAVFWLAHAYTDTLGAAITDGAREGGPSLRHALRTEWPIVESGVAPLLALGIAAAAGARASTAATAALVVAVLELLGWALLAARRARLTGLRRLLYCAVITLLGLGLAALKYLLH